MIGLKKSAGACFTLSVFIFSGCMAAAMPADQPTSTTQDLGLAEAHTQFGFKLFGELTRGKEEKNLFVSPTSVAIALTMALDGASGPTREAMAKALGIEGMSPAKVNELSAALFTSLGQPGSKARLDIANSLWARQGIQVKPDFASTMKNLYGARIATLDFNNPQTLGVINGWVKEKTQNKIPTIIDRIDPQSVLYLINAIYFKGTWQRTFDAQKTRDAPFYLADAGQKNVPMMSQSGHYPYFRGERFQALRLPYGDGRISMLIFLPDKDSSLKAFLGSLSAESWGPWMERFRRTEGRIKLPRFKMEYAATLNEPLKRIGMELAFDPAMADFSNMLETSERAYISEVRHKTFVEVNEEGTEAAAATSVGIALTSVRPQPQKIFVMEMDHPFFCAIRDERTGEILFMGMVTNPS